MSSFFIKLACSGIINDNHSAFFVVDCDLEKERSFDKTNLSEAAVISQGS
jgi:hypothetical protein